MLILKREFESFLSIINFESILGIELVSMPIIVQKSIKINN
jgi:hypothetical protein